MESQEFWNIWKLLVTTFHLSKKCTEKWQKYVKVQKENKKKILKIRALSVRGDCIRGNGHSGKQLLGEWH